MAAAASGLRFLLRIVGVGVALWAPHTPTRPQQPVFRASTDAVPLWIAVTDSAGEPVLDLNLEDFEILDNGQRAEPVAFSRQASPLALRVLVANTPRLRKEEARVRSLAYAIIERMLPSEMLGLSGAWRSMNGYGPFSADKDLLRREFDSTFRPVGTEGLYWWWSLAETVDAFRSAASSLTPSVAWLKPGLPVWATGQLPSVRGVIVLSPGMDQLDGEPKSSDRHVGWVRLDGTIVYGVAFGGRTRDKRLGQLAPATSGWLLEPDKRTNVLAEADRILTDLRNRYLLGFVPVAFDGKEHTLSVKVRRSGVTVRARTAYLAPK
jgi:VWFA-related protein